MGKETKPSSSFTADFLTRAGAVCSVPDDAPWLCESGSAGSGGCVRPRCRVSAGDTGAKGPRRRRTLERGEQSMGLRGARP